MPTDKPKVSEALRPFADPKNWVCRRCGKHDPINCYCGQYQGPLVSTEPYDSPKNQPWFPLQLELTEVERLEKRVEALEKGLRELFELIEANAPDGYYTEHPAITRAYKLLYEDSDAT